MIKKLVAPIVFLFVCSLAQAQRFDGGIIAGLNATQVEGDSYKGFHKPGLVAGFYVETDIAPAVFASMEIKFSQKGARNKIKENDPTKYIMRLDYIDIPVLMGFRTNERGSVVAGISPGFLISAKEFDNYGEFPVEDQNAFNTLDLQALLGFQFGITEKLKLDLRFALSLLPIRKYPDEVPPSHYWVSNQFNNVITLGLYYKIGN